MKSIITIIINEIHRFSFYLQPQPFRPFSAFIFLCSLLITTSEVKTHTLTMSKSIDICAATNPCYQFFRPEMKFIITVFRSRGNPSSFFFSQSPRECSRMRQAPSAIYFQNLIKICTVEIQLRLNGLRHLYEPVMCVLVRTF
jgi:hypothetical protein